MKQTRALLYHGLVHLVTEQSNCTLLLPNLKRDKRESYKKMICYYEFSRHQEYPEDMIFQQDLAPPQYAIIVHQYFD